jgi:hypothetical protein
VNIPCGGAKWVVTVIIVIVWQIVRQVVIGQDRQRLRVRVILVNGVEFFTIVKQFRFNEVVNDFLNLFGSDRFAKLALKLFIVIGGPNDFTIVIQ